VLDLDIKSFFDEIDWALLMRAVRRHTDCRPSPRLLLSRLRSNKPRGAQPL
jgi:retron-type reverse transcriptase